jgi:hypothetical protein
LRDQASGHVPAQVIERHDPLQPRRQGWRLQGPDAARRESDGTDPIGPGRARIIIPPRRLGPAGG